MISWRFLRISASLNAKRQGTLKVFPVASTQQSASETGNLHFIYLLEVRPFLMERKADFVSTFFNVIRRVLDPVYSVDDV